MPRTTAVRNYGKPSKRSKAERLFAELPQSPMRKPAGDGVTGITKQLSAVRIDEAPRARSPEGGRPERGSLGGGLEGDAALRVLTWDDVCPPGDRIVKIAEASYAEVYRVSNERGTSIVKAIRLASPIKPRTKAQVRAGLVDEEPHPDDDVKGELQISEWLADVPGFVVYKERYVVRGKATAQLLQTHQAFQKRVKRQDPDRAQFYPSPSRYLAETKFLVVELGDAGTALEDWELTDESQLWDIFLLEAIALARAEDLAMFEHRDLHEGNICVKRVRPPRARDAKRRGGGGGGGGGGGVVLGHSGLDITILDFGLSRATDPSAGDAATARPVAFDLERDLGLFTSTHASQCAVYRRMRSFLLRADRTCIPPEGHRTPYARGVAGPLSWDAYAPYTNVLWLAYLYDHLTARFRGGRRALARFTSHTARLWAHLDPDADAAVPCFASAAEVVCFAVEAGWVAEEQLRGDGASMLGRHDGGDMTLSPGEAPRVPVRRSSRRRKA